MSDATATQALVRKAARIHALLLREYGTPRWTRLDGVSEMVATILSQNTNDANRDLAYTRLRARFNTWEDVRDAKTDDIVEAIRPAGLANQKGPRIQQALRRITAERGALNIDFLADLPVDAARAWLTSFNGIGPKTAAIVLLFCYDRPAFPVDAGPYPDGFVIRLQPFSAAGKTDLLSVTSFGKDGTVVRTVRIKRISCR